MKHLNFLHLVLLLCTLFSCGKEFQVPVDNAPLETPSTYVSIDEAREEVITALSQIDNLTKGLLPQRYIVEEYQLGCTATKNTSEDISPLVYIFNFNDNNGFAIASGDNRMPPVFCITDQGHFTDSITIPESVAIMLSMIEDEYKSVVRNGYDSFVTEIDSLYILPGDGIGDGDDDEEGDYIPPTYNIYGHWISSVPQGQIIPSEWGQDSPFNEMCPLENGNHDLVGCVAVAVGQIMYYWKQNTTYNGHIYNWTIMSQFKDENSLFNSNNKDVQNLLRDLGGPENLDMDYGLDGSYANCDNISRTFNNFGYSSGGTPQEYDVSIVKSEINAGRPVIVCGRAHKIERKILGVTVYIDYSGGHEWIIDQYYTQSRTVDTYDTKTSQLISSTTENRTIVHCNMGWAGYLSGYYLSGKFYTYQGEGLITRSGHASDIDGNYKYLLTVHSGIQP